MAGLILKVFRDVALATKNRVDYYLILSAKFPSERPVNESEYEVLIQMVSGVGVRNRLHW